MPRFVLLRHECPPSFGKPSHWDLMFERGEVLETWQLTDLPASWARQLGLALSEASDVVPAIRLPDHRIAYLDYEGPLSGDRGSVHQCDGGSYELLAQQEDQEEFRLSGKALIGIAIISQAGANWHLTATLQN